MTLALGKRARLLILDEPLADLDPLARQEVTGALMAAAADTGATVVLSSHILTDLADTCDYLLLLNRGRLQLAGGLEELTEAHRIVTGPAALGEQLRAAPTPPVHVSTTARQTTAAGAPRPQRPHRHPVGRCPSLDELVLAYLRNPDATLLPAATLVSSGE